MSAKTPPEKAHNETKRNGEGSKSKPEQGGDRGGFHFNLKSLRTLFKPLNSKHSYQLTLAESNLIDTSTMKIRSYPEGIMAKETSTPSSKSDTKVLPESKSNDLKLEGKVVDDENKTSRNLEISRDLESNGSKKKKSKKNKRAPSKPDSKEMVNKTQPVAARMEAKTKYDAKHIQEEDKPEKIKIRQGITLEQINLNMLLTDTFMPCSKSIDVSPQKLEHFEGNGSSSEYNQIVQEETNLPGEVSKNRIYDQNLRKSTALETCTPKDLQNEDENNPQNGKNSETNKEDECKFDSKRSSDDSHNSSAKVNDNYEVQERDIEVEENKNVEGMECNNQTENEVKIDEEKNIFVVDEENYFNAHEYSNEGREKDFLTIKEKDNKENFGINSYKTEDIQLSQENKSSKDENKEIKVYVDKTKVAFIGVNEKKIKKKRNSSKKLSKVKKTKEADIKSGKTSTKHYTDNPVVCDTAKYSNEQNQESQNSCLTRSGDFIKERGSNESIFEENVNEYASTKYFRDEVNDELQVNEEINSAEIKANLIDEIHTTGIKENANQQEENLEECSVESKSSEENISENLSIKCLQGEGKEEQCFNDKSNSTEIEVSSSNQNQNTSINEDVNRQEENLEECSVKSKSSEELVIIKILNKKEGYENRLKHCVYDSEDYHKLYMEFVEDTKVLDRIKTSGNDSLRQLKRQALRTIITFQDQLDDIHM